jgi:uncharacterized protein (TIGR01244 family)
MQTIRKINDDLAIAGQIELEQLTQLVEDGFKSILNLRNPQEKGFLPEEQATAEALQLNYVNLPFEIEFVSDQTSTQVLQSISRLPKPILVHCDNAVRAAAIALMHIATRQGATLEEAFHQAKQLGLFSVLTQA